MGKDEKLKQLLDKPIDEKLKEVVKDKLKQVNRPVKK